MKTAANQFTTISGVPIEPVYGPEELADLDQKRDLGAPGEFPYTRGIHRDMYRGKLWTMRQFSGFATPEETNRRYHYLLQQGQTGLSVAFDLPTLMGYDADHAMSEGEVGKCGVSICSLEDMEILFRGIPLANVTVSMTINSPAAVLWAMYLAVAEQQGADWAHLSGGWRKRIDQKIAELQRLRDGLTQCIGCGCLSIDKCSLANPADQAGRRGPGPRYWLG